MKELIYAEMEEKIIDFISEQRTMVLATSDKEKVTARTVFLIYRYRDALLYWDIH